MSRVLLVTIILTGRTGTEVVCCETARGLRKRKHDVAIYTQQDGPRPINCVRRVFRSRLISHP